MPKRHFVATLPFAAVVALTAPPAAAQVYYGACCLPDGGCLALSTVDCSVRGGMFLASVITCEPDDPCDPPPGGEIAMSRTAASRLVNQGVIHSIEVSNTLGLYSSDDFDHPFWDTVDAAGAVVAPMIHLDPRFITGDHSPEQGAEDLLDAVLACKEAFALNHPDKDFYWSVRLAVFGGAYDWERPDGSVPTFTNHEADTPEGILDSHHFVWRIQGTVDPSNPSTLTVIKGDAAWLTALGGFETGYFTTPAELAPAEIAFYGPFDSYGGTATLALRGTRVPILAVDHLTGNITVPTLPAVPGAGDHFFIERRGISPSFFFKNGGDECAAWIDRFADQVEHLLTVDDTYAGIGSPKAVIVTTEDLLEQGTSWFSSCPDPSSYEMNLNDEVRSTDPDQSIDGTNTLADWHAAKFNKMDSDGDPAGLSIPECGFWDPAHFHVRSYAFATYAHAYNHHRNRSVWLRLRELWPDAHYPQYQLNPGGTRASPVPIWPGETSYHAEEPLWNESVTWDEYYAGLDSTFKSAFKYQAHAVPTGNTNTIKVTTLTAGNNTDTLDNAPDANPPSNWLLVVMSGSQAGQLRSISGWTQDTRTVALAAALGGAPAAGDSVWVVQGGTVRPTTISGESAPTASSFQVVATPLAPDETNIPVWRDAVVQPGDVDERVTDRQIEFVSGALTGQTFLVTGWDRATDIMTLSTNLPAGLVSGDTFWLYHEDFRFADRTVNGVPTYRFLASYAERHDIHTLDAAGLKATQKSWAAEQVRQYTRAFPDNPYCIFYAAGDYGPFGAAYDGQPQFVTGEWAYPDPGFFTTDGFLDGADWGEIGSQAVNHGVNHFVWFQPEIVHRDSGAPNTDMNHVAQAIAAIQQTYDDNLDVYEDIADNSCDGDHDNDLDVDVSDIFAFLSDWFAFDPDADADGSGSVEVSDIFAFLSDWFAACV